MSLAPKTLLHIVDKDAKFRAARFLTDQTTEATWDAFPKHWVNPIVRFSDFIASDQGPRLQSEWDYLIQFNEVLDQ